MAPAGSAVAAPQVSRRQLAKRLGAVALLVLPMVAGMSVPASAQQGSIPAACLLCIDSSNNGVNCGVCANIVGTCYNNNGCSNGGANSNQTCAACATYLFVGQAGNNTWKYPPQVG